MKNRESGTGPCSGSPSRWINQALSAQVRAARYHIPNSETAVQCRLPVTDQTRLRNLARGIAYETPVASSLFDTRYVIPFFGLSLSLFLVTVVKFKMPLYPFLCVAELILPFSFIAIHFISLYHPTPSM